MENVMRLLEKCRAAGCAAKLSPEVLESALNHLPFDSLAATRLLTRNGNHEDAAIVRLPENVTSRSLVQTLDFFTPVVNDPYAFGQIAAANALSDIYAMGGDPWCAMNIVCFPVNDMPAEVLHTVLKGGMDKLAEAGVVLAGGHSVDDPEIKYGLSVSGFVSSTSFASNTGLIPGQKLLLTKRLGTGILATAIKAAWEGWEEFEKLLIASAAKLNAGGAKVIKELELKAATDITGFGLGGHLLEMAEASQVGVNIIANDVPALPHAKELAATGLVPAGSYRNKKYRSPSTLIQANVDPVLVDIIFDAQTSGGIVLALDEKDIAKATDILGQNGDEAFLIGEVTSYQSDARLHIA